MNEATQEAPAISYEANVEFVQNIAKPNCGRCLTEKEIKRLDCAFLECDEAQDALMTALIAAIEDAMDNSSGQWDDFDARERKVV